MEIAKTYSYRHAEAIMEHEYSQEMAEIREVIGGVAWVALPQPKVRRRDGRVVCIKTIDQVKTNVVVERAFKALDWQIKPEIVSESDSKLAADYKKGNIQVEVQFGNMARWYTDIFKFLLSYSANDIEIGVLIVPMHVSANCIDENVVYFERVIRELPHAKMAVTIPVWVVGVNGGVPVPDGWQPPVEVANPDEGSD